MKKILLWAAIALCGLGWAAAQTGSCNYGGTPQCTDKQTIAANGGAVTIVANGGLFPSFEYLISGSPSSISIIVQGCGVGGTCEILDTYATVANAIRNPAVSKPYGYFTVTATWSGGTSVSVAVNAKITTAAGSPPPSETASNALSPSVQASLTTPVVVKAGAGDVFGVYALNGAITTCWVQFINAASSPVLGTNVVFSIPLPASVSQPVYVSPGAFALANFPAGISVGIATTATGSTPCGTAGNLTAFYE
jgi:hypothetical protein